MDEEQGLMNSIPPFTEEDYLEGTAPYEYAYQFINDGFTLERVLVIMSKRAWENAKVRNFRKLFSEYVKKEKQITKMITLDSITQFEGQELELNCGEWKADEFGVCIETDFGTKYACNHPILPVMRLVNIDTGIEKLVIAYRKGKQWRHVVADKKTLASNTAILDLANVGVGVTSENSKLLVQYLYDIEMLNYDIIPEKNSVSRLGWIENSGFSPYVEELVFDGDANFKTFFDSVHMGGDYGKWLELAREIRAGQCITTRIILAASFASVLVKILGGLPFFVHLWGGTEAGKAQPLDTKIITPDGYKLMGDLSVGDMVIGRDGKPHPVTGVYPQGKKEVYQITFKDGTTTKCCKEHLWWIQTRTRKNHGRGFKVMSLEEIMKLPIKTKGYNLSVPISQPVQYATTSELPIDPYLLGALLGDGCITLKKNPRNHATNIYFNNSENDVIEKVKSILGARNMGLRENKYSTNQWVLNGEGKKKLCDDIRKLNLNVLGRDKFIPNAYMRASIQDRHSLLCGLMDTDGTVNKLSGSFSYSTESDRLANDILELCRSLGYRATNHRLERQRDSKISIENTIRIWTSDEIFTSEKHKKRYAISKSNRKSARVESHNSLPIIDIKFVGIEQCQCIMVDNADHTYLCDDYIVTHNTVGLMLAASVWANPEIGRFIHTFNSTSVGREKSAAFVNSLPLVLDELQIIKDKKDFDQNIYMLSEGAGRTRGTKTGGVDKTPTWSNCILTSGEMPLTGHLSGGGAVNRIVEIECRERLFDEPRRAADTVKRNYGHAGRIFVECLQQDGGFELAETTFKGFYESLSLNDTTEKQAMAAAMILTADKLATDWVFGDNRELKTDDITEFLQSKAAVSVNARAYDYLCEYVIQNKHRFCGNSDQNEVWGLIDDGMAYIVRSVFNRICADAGFNDRSLLSWLKENDLIELGTKGFTKAKRINGQLCHCVFLRLPCEEEEDLEMIDDI